MENKNIKYWEIVSIVLIVIGLFFQEDFIPITRYIFGLILFIVGVLIWFKKEQIVESIYGK